MAGRITDTRLHPWLVELAAASDYVALCSVDPFTVGDPLSVEIGTSRAAGTFARVSRLIRNTTILVWAGIPSGSSVGAFAGYDVSINGAPLWSVLISPVLTYPAGGSLTVAIDELFVGFDL